MSDTPLPFIVLLSLFHGTEQQGGFAPHGCTYNNGDAQCDFQEWSPPLQEKDFGPKSMDNLILNNINGTIPAQAFGELNSGTYLTLNCDNCNTRLSRSIFTPNLHWLKQLRIDGCFLDDGLPSRLFENLKSLKYLRILSGRIEGLVAHDTLVGLINLQSVYIRATVENGILPPGFFDGLINLYTIDLRDAMLDFIPANWFSGLGNLTQVFLMGNNLQMLPPGLFDELRSLTKVWLGDNPWHCTCELTWLLDWSNVTTGGECERQVGMQIIGLEYGLRLLNCSPSTPAVLSTPLSSKTEIEDTQTSLTSTFEGSLVSSKVTSSRQKLTALMSTLAEETFAMSINFSAVPLTFTATATPKTTAIASTMTSLTTQANSTVSCLASSADTIGATQTTVYLSSILFAGVTFVQTVYYSTPRKSENSKSRNTNHGIVNNLRNIVLISGVGALTVVFVVAVAVYGCVWRIHCFGSVIPIDDEEGDRHDPDSQSRNIAGQC